MPAAPRDPTAPAPAGADADVTRAAAGLPSLTLDPAQADDLDAVVSGALAPGAALTLRVPAGEPVRAGEPVALRDLEGVPLAVLRVDRVDEAAAGGGTVTVTGGLAVARRPDRPDYRWLRRSAAEARALAAERGWGAPVTALVEPAPPTPEALADAVAAAGGRLVALALERGAADDPAHHRRMRAWLRAAEPHGDAVLLSLVPAALPADAAAAAALRERLARNYGADALAPSPGPDATGDPGPAAGGGATVFFTGLSGSGKSTIAGRLLVRLMETGRSTSLLDGDVVRTHLSKGLGFSRDDRDTNVRRIGFVAAEITKHGGIAICAPIAPYDATRRDVRAMVERYGRFVLVHVATPLEVCEQRDRKGLYAKARAGEIPEFTGVSDPYETPGDAELVVDTRTESADDAAERVLGYLRAAGIVPAPGEAR